MIYSSLLLAVTAFSASVSAQNYSTSGNLSIDASQIDIVTRQAWCRGQTNSCPYLCDGSTAANDCDPTALTYTCTCAAGTQLRNVSDYSQTLPAFICAQWVSNCVDNHPNDLPGITACRSVICGSKNATALGSNTSDSGTSSSAAPSTTTAATTTLATQAASTSASATPTRTGAAVALSVAQTYGTTIFSAAILGFFGLAL